MNILLKSAYSSQCLVKTTREMRVKKQNIFKKCTHKTKIEAHE